MVQKSQQVRFYVHFTCVFVLGSTGAFLHLLRSSFCPTWVFSSLLCCTFELLLGVSAFVCVLVGIERVLLVLRGLIRIGVSFWCFRRRLDLRGLLSTGDVVGSERNFLRGISLMLASATAPVCFLLEGEETSCRRQGRLKSFGLLQMLVVWLESAKLKQQQYEKSHFCSL